MRWRIYVENPSLASDRHCLSHLLRGYGACGRTRTRGGGIETDAACAGGEETGRARPYHVQLRKRIRWLCWAAATNMASGLAEIPNCGKK